MGLRQIFRDFLFGPEKIAAFSGSPTTVFNPPAQAEPDGSAFKTTQASNLLQQRQALSQERYKIQQPPVSKEPLAQTSKNYPPLFNPLTAPEDDFQGALQAAKKLTGGRLTQEKEGLFFGKYRVVLPPSQYEQFWRFGNLDEETLRRVDPVNMVLMLADLSPDVSKAIWDFLRFCNPGFEWTAYRKNAKVPDPRATQAIQSFLDVLADDYGSFEVLISKMFLGAFLRGGFLVELVLDADAKTPIDLAVPDPATVRFLRYNDDIRGWVNIPFQYQRGGPVMLDRRTVRYTAIDPMPGDPYGRPLVTPAIFSTLFLLGLLHDLRRVIAQQGYPRLDVTVMIEAIRNTMPADVQGNPLALQEWVNATLKEIQVIYSHLEPEDAFVHTDAVAVGNPVSAAGGANMKGIMDVIKFVERMAIRSLKTMPILMGSVEGVTEANANRQWEIHIAGIKALQHYAEETLERLLTLALQAQGIPGRVRWRFQELRAAEELRDQQTLTLKVNNNFQMQMNGWIDADEAAMNVVGHKAFKDQPITPPSMTMKENFEGFSVPAAKTGEVKGEPKPNQPNANPNKKEAGGDQKPKNNAIDPMKAKTGREIALLNPEFAAQVEGVLAAQSTNGAVHHYHHYDEKDDDDDNGTY